MVPPASKNPFVDLLEAELRTANAQLRPMAFPAAHVIFREGDFGDGIYVIDEGTIEISALMPERQCRVLSHMGKGEVFGEMAVVDEQPRSATATAQTAARVRFIPREEVWRILGQSPVLLIALMKEVCIRMRRSEQRCTEDVFQAERLALVGSFAQSIVHDLKNPLNTIGVGVELACAEGTAPEVRKEAGELIRKQVGRLGGMIHEVLEFTRGTARSLMLAPVEIREFVREAIAELKPGVAEHRVTIECDGEPPAATVLADRTRLMHVFNNLVNNAVDAMPFGGKIVLRFQLAEREVIAEIEDNGPGIPPPIATRLFEPFVTHGKTNGTGLGLSICKRIIEDHGGRIRAIEKPGCGAIFSFSLQRQV